MPEIVADADQRGAGQHHPIDVRKSHHQVGKADPEQRHRHQQALAADRVDEDAARHVGDRAGRELAGQDRADLAVAQAEFVADQRQQQIERRRIPMRQRMPDADDPDLLKRASWPRARFGRNHCHPGIPWSNPTPLSFRRSRSASGCWTVCTAAGLVEQSPSCKVVMSKRAARISCRGGCPGDDRFAPPRPAVWPKPPAACPARNCSPATAPKARWRRSPPP